VQVPRADLWCGEAGEFDLAWSMESGEHMPDKQKFVNELVRVTAPGGRIIIVTWCGLSFENLDPGCATGQAMCMLLP
jgi:SAM-dependent methyltransferase